MLKRLICNSVVVLAAAMEAALIMADLQVILETQAVVKHLGLVHHQEVNRQVLVNQRYQAWDTYVIHVISQDIGGVIAHY